MQFILGKCALPNLESDSGFRQWAFSGWSCRQLAECPDLEHVEEFGGENPSISVEKVYW